MDHKSFLTIDERELRLALQDQNTDIEELIKNNLNKSLIAPFSVTLGTEGSIYCSKDGALEKVPVFFSKPVDTVGAGDAYFAITSLLSYLKTSPLLISFIGNIFAGLKTNIVGNKNAVKKVDLLRAIKTLMG